MIRYFKCDNGFAECIDSDSYSWINVESPDSEDYESLSQNLHVPADFLEYVADKDENPRIEHDAGWTLAIIRIPARLTSGGAPFNTIPIGIIFNGKVIISVCNKKTEMLEDFISYTRIRRICVLNVVEFILRLINSASVWYLRYLSEINEEVDESEKKLERNVQNKDILRLMQLQKSLVLFNTSINGDISIISRLQTLYPDDIEQNLLEDVEIEIRQAQNTTSIYSDILGNAMDAFGSIISNNANDVMKRMTSVSIVLMVPTLIASFYGMNVDITLSESTAAFWIILAMAAVLTTACWYLFRRLHWL